MKPSTTNSTVYISNLSYKRDRNGIKSMLIGLGQIKNIKIVVEPSTNQSRGMAFVEMGNATEANNIILNLNGKIIDGRTIKVKPATPLKTASRSRMDKPALKKEKDLDYVSVQLAKKARNEARRKSNPLQFKLKGTKTKA